MSSNMTKTIKRGIRTKILSAFIAVIIVSMSILGIGTYLKAQGIMQENLIDSSGQILKQSKNNIDSYLESFESIGNFVDTDANVLSAYNAPTSEMWMGFLFENVKKNYPDIQNVYVAYKDKRLFVYPKAVGLPAGFDPTVKPWYENAVANKGKLIWSVPYIDTASKKLVVTLSKTVVDAKNNVVGVMGIDVLMDNVDKQLSGISIGKKGYPILVDENGIVMTHRDKSMIGKKLEVKELQDLVANPSLKQVSYKFKEDGQDVSKFAIINKVEKTGWSLIATMYYDEISDDSNSLLFIIVLVAIISILASVGIIYFTTNGIITNIKKLMETMKIVRTGDLSKPDTIDSNDEIGVLGGYFSDTIKDLGMLVSNVKNVSSDLTLAAQTLAATSEEASASADEVAKTVDDIAKGANAQAKDAENGSVIARNISDQFVMLSENTNLMIDAAENLNNANKTGLNAIDTLKSKTDLTNIANNKIQVAITELSTKMQDIGKILDSISAVSVQTNLLALNASIEAARAGEHGRGFAVVADEIRKLAEESAKSADEVRVILTAIQGDSDKTVESMDELKVIALDQNNAVGDVLNSFDTISNSYEEISQQISSIGHSVTQLNKDKDGLVESIEKISAVSEETAAASEEVNASMDQQASVVEEVAKSAEHLNEVSVNLSSEISKFRI